MGTSLSSFFFYSFCSSSSPSFFSSFFSSSSLFSSPSIVVPRPRPVPHSRTLGKLVDLLPLPLTSPLPPPLPLLILLLSTIEWRSRGRTTATLLWSSPRRSSPQGSPVRHRGQPELYFDLIYPQIHLQHPGALRHWTHLMAWCCPSSWHRRHLHDTTSPRISSPHAGGMHIWWLLLPSQEGGGVEE